MKISRRKFNGLIPAGIFSLTNSQIINALESKTNENNYIQINLFGSPSRWYFDSILKPTSDSPFKHLNKMISTSASSIGHEIKASYETVKYKKLNVPPLWNEKLVNGKALGSIFDNSLIIRGCDMILDGHENISRKLVTPFQGGESLTGRLSDRSTRVFPTIQYLQDTSPLSTTPGAFKSSLDKSPINLFENEDYFDAIFITQSNSSKPSEESINKINKFFGLQSSSLKKIRKLDKLNISKLRNKFNHKVNAYEEVIKKTIKSYSSLSVLSKDISGFDITNHSHSYTSTDLIYDITAPYNANGLIVLDKDLKKGLNSIIFIKLAEQFAMTELLLEEKLSSSFILMVMPPGNIKFEKATSHENFEIVQKNGREIIQLRDSSKISPETVDFTFDTHDYGFLFEYVINNAFFYTLGNCIEKFKDFLITHDIYDNSLIHLLSEFERTPKHNLAGSDHGFQGHTSTLISGKFQDLNITGNIVTNSKSKHVLNNNNGTWGMGAPIKGLGNRTISYRNILNTVCDLLQVPRMSKSDASLVYKKDNSWLPIFGALNIDNEDV